MTRDTTRRTGRHWEELTRVVNAMRAAVGAAEESGRDHTAMAGSAELRRAMGFLGWHRDASWIVAAGYRAGVVVGLLAVVVTAVLSRPLVGLVVGTALGLATTHAVHRAPVWLATLRRTRALGAAPGLVGRLVLCMRLDPSTERAVRFAARTGQGPLARALARHERRSVNAPTSGLRSFAHEWREWFPAIERASTLLRTAAAAPPERRGRSLDRALEATLTGTTERLAAFVGAVEGPVSALYAFGVLLPLAFVALLPAAAASGVPLPASVVAGLYLVVLPVALVAAGAWLLARRPVAFPPPRVGGDHPAVPDRRVRAVVVGGLAAAGAGIVTGTIVARWAAPVGAAGVGVGVALLVAVRPRRIVLARVKATESGLPDAMTVVGGAVAEGVAVERAIASAGDRLTGATGDLFARAGRRSDTLRVDVREAFIGEGGPAATVPSPRVHGAVALLAIAAREGRPAGDVVLELADRRRVRTARRRCDGRSRDGDRRRGRRWTSFTLYRRGCRCPSGRKWDRRRHAEGITRRRGWLWSAPDPGARPDRRSVHAPARGDTHRPIDRSRAGVRRDARGVPRRNRAADGDGHLPRRVRRGRAVVVNTSAETTSRPDSLCIEPRPPSPCSRYTQTPRTPGSGSQP